MWLVYDMYINYQKVNIDTATINYHVDDGATYGNKTTSYSLKNKSNK